MVAQVTIVARRVAQKRRTPIPTSDRTLEAGHGRELARDESLVGVGFIAPEKPQEDEMFKQLTGNDFVIQARALAMNAVGKDLALELLLEKSQAVPSPRICAWQLRIKKPDHGQSFRLEQKVIVPGVALDVCVEKSCGPEQAAEKLRVLPISKRF
jgi:hypothetical protein